MKLLSEKPYVIMEKGKIISRLRGKLDEMHIPYGDIDCYDGPTTVTVKVQFDGGVPVGNTPEGVEEEFDTFKDVLGKDDYSGINVPLVAVCNVPPVAQCNVPPQKWLQ